MTKIRARQIVDGSGSGLDADALDGKDSTDFVTQAELLGNYSRWRGAQPAEPLDPRPGDLWFDLNEMKLKVYVGMEGITWY